MIIDPHIDELNAKVLQILHGNAALNAQLIFNGKGEQLLDTARQSDKKGRDYLHMMHPDEFEYYACAFELLDSDGKSDTFFSFPVMPDSIDENNTSNVNIKKTQGGVVVNSSSTFLPFDIAISGDFGRRFRRLVSRTALKPSAGGSTDIENTGGTIYQSKIETTKLFDSDYKTGYGVTKVLELLLEKSKGQDDKFLPYRLFFYNFSLNSHYLVEVINKRIFQNKDKNMIWSYSISMKTVAPADAFYSDGIKASGRLEQVLSFTKRNQEFNTQSEGIKDLLKGKGVNATKIEMIFQKQIASKAMQSLTNNQTSAIQAITQLTANPNDIDDFAVNIGEGILTRL